MLCYCSANHQETMRALYSCFTSQVRNQQQCKSTSPDLRHGPGMMDYKLIYCGDSQHVSNFGFLQTIARCKVSRNALKTHDIEGLIAEGSLLFLSNMSRQTCLRCDRRIQFVVIGSQKSANLTPNAF